VYKKNVRIQASVTKNKVVTNESSCFQSGHNYPLLIKHLLRVPLTYFPKQEIVYKDRARYSYVEFSNRLSRLANGLTQRGIKAGDTIGIMDWDSNRYLECFFAVPMMGATLHTINVRLSLEKLIHTINQAKDDILLVNTEFLPLIEAVRDKLNTVKHIIRLSDCSSTDNSELPGAEEYESILANGNDCFEFPDFDENTRATLFFTTGTTGEPKGVSFSHRQLVLHTYGIMSALCSLNSQTSISAADVYMPITPMFHVHAWGFPYLMTYLGAKQVYPGRYDPDVLLALQRRENVSFSHCVPTILNMLIERLTKYGKGGDGWKIMVGGSPLSRGLCKTSLDLDLNVFTGYGMSETCPVLTIATLKPHMRGWSRQRQIECLCRSGLPIPNVHMELVDSDGNLLAHDGKAVGEIIVRAPWLTQGYLNDAEGSAKLWADGWLHTGDAGYIDPEGYLQITDRLKDLIKSGGEWVSSLELEDILSQHPGVAEAAVVGIVDKKWGERPLALVVLKKEIERLITVEELREFFQIFVENGSISKLSIPDTILFVRDIPKTSVGKIDKKKIRCQYQ
jgi:fatty-acyl-CoA synthase